MITKGNIFSETLPKGDEPEVFQELHRSNQIVIEKITTFGSLKKPGEWYDQEKDEWVILLQGEAELEFAGDKDIKLSSGDYLFIPSHKRHRVIKTSASPHCIWLAVHSISD